MLIPQPYLLFLGDVTDPLAAKTARGIQVWRPDHCLGQLRLPACTVSLGLDDLSIEEAAARGARTLVQLDACVDANLRAAAVTCRDVKLAGFAINTSGAGEAQARDYCRWLSEQFGVPATDPVRFGIGEIARLLQEQG